MDIDMDMRLKPCKRLLVDRLTTLPVELLIRILSLLPTKDAAATCVLSKRMRRVFPWITSLDFDDSPISHCLKHPSGIERFPTFVTFVDTVLRSHQSQYLTRFRFGVGPEFMSSYHLVCSGVGQCKKGCCPDLKSIHIDAWISFPLTRCGLRELDLRIWVREESGVQLAPEIFTCETLEVLKLDINLGLHRASAMPSFHLPNLKLFVLLANFISEDGFVTRLVSSCPLLEDLTVKATWNHAQFTSISSPSLKRLCLFVSQVDIYDKTDIVRFDTPNLEYLEYCDNLALQYSFTNMNHLIKADIFIEYHPLVEEELEVYFQQMLNLIRHFPNVQHLALTGMCTEDLNLAELKNQLPVYHNLKHLELGNYSRMYWDELMLAFLNCSPALETLVFPQGFLCSGVTRYNDDDEEPREFCTTTQAIIPKCCRYHLKRIVIKSCFGDKREIHLIQFLLRHALVLEELVVCRPAVSAVVDQMTLESTLQNLPRASVSCLIQVQQETRKLS